MGKGKKKTLGWQAGGSVKGGGARFLLLDGIIWFDRRGSPGNNGGLSAQTFKALIAASNSSSRLLHPYQVIHPLPFDAGGAFPDQSIAYLVFASLTFYRPSWL